MEATALDATMLMATMVEEIMKEAITVEETLEEATTVEQTIEEATVIAVEETMEQAMGAMEERPTEAREH